MIELLLLINAARVQPLKLDPVLSERAEIRADYLCDHKQWSHKHWRDSFKGLPYIHYGENLAEGFRNTKEAHKAFMKSPTHKANIKNINYKKVGIGQTKCRGKTITVELFGG